MAWNVSDGVLGLALTDYIYLQQKGHVQKILVRKMTLRQRDSEVIVGKSLVHVNLPDEASLLLMAVLVALTHDGSQGCLL